MYSVRCPSHFLVTVFKVTYSFHFHIYLSRTKYYISLSNVINHETSITWEKEILAPVSFLVIKEDVKIVGCVVVSLRVK